MNSNATYLSGLTKEQLVSKVLYLQSKTKDKTNASKRHRAAAKPLDFAKYSCRRIALKFAYQGWNYFGLTATEHDMVETVESHIFDALVATKLIPADRSLCDWSRCGRTDRGVSSYGQISALIIRSNIPKDDPRALNWNTSENPVDPKCRQRSMTVLEIDDDSTDFNELPYLTMLNRHLPGDIRILAWSPVSENFDARFSCIWRRYKVLFIIQRLQYYFPKGDLNIENMQTAANYFIGSHDFRNFAKIDNRHIPNSYVRHIHESKIIPQHTKPSEDDAPTDFYVFELRGSAFLWHQVRCMMAVLYLIGKGKESPLVVSDLLDLSQHDENAGKPIYNMASELPLVLTDCGYSNGWFKWHLEDCCGFSSKVTYDDKVQSKVLERAWDLWKIDATKGAVIGGLCNSIASDSNRIGAEPTGPKSYVPLMKRLRCDGINLRREKGEIERLRKQGIELVDPIRNV